MIGVTRFFRDADAFEALRIRFIEPFLATRPDSIRAWIPGCSTGEETYTIAMIFMEAMRKADLQVPLQVFGTDIDVPALVRARSGLYGAGAAENIPEDLLTRFFREEEKGWRAVPVLHEACVFAPHNVIQDPPYSRLNLVSCRNLMIYMSNELQQKLIPRFHFALRPSGGMLLGPSETLAGQDEMFETIDKTWRLYRKNDAVPARYTPLSDRVPMSKSRSLPTEMRINASGMTQPDPDVSRERQAVRTYLADHAKAFALITADREVAHLSEAMTRFVKPTRGEPSARIDAFLAADLRIPVRSALADAATSKTEAGVQNVVVAEGDKKALFDVSVSPASGSDGMYLLVLDEIRFREGETAVASVEARQSEDRMMLEREVASVREQYMHLQNEHENATQESNSSNEELLSMNEELQSSNEELETSREELQSINEELETVNAELSENNRQLVRANSDLKNLFESTDMATLFLDPSLAVRGFTPATSPPVRHQEPRCRPSHPRSVVHHRLSRTGGRCRRGSTHVAAHRAGSDDAGDGGNLHPAHAPLPHYG